MKEQLKILKLIYLEAPSLTKNLIYRYDNRLLYILRAIKLCLTGGYFTASQKESKKLYVSYRQLIEKEKHLYEYLSHIEISSVNELPLSIAKRLSILMIVIFSAPLFILIQNGGIILLTYVLYRRLAYVKRHKTFVYFAFLPEVLLTLRLFRLNNGILDYLELSNFFENEITIDGNCLTTVFEFNVQYLNRNSNLKFKKINHIVSNQCILEKAKQIQYKSQSICYYASGYYERIKVSSHDPNFLKLAEKQERKIIRILSDICEENSWHLVIAPHYTRNVENITNAKNYYYSILRKNKLDYTTVSENTEIATRYNLTVTYGSNAFFDSVFNGVKAVLVDGPEILSNQIGAPILSRFLLSSNDLRCSVIKSLLFQNNISFYEEKLFPVIKDSMCIK